MQAERAGPPCARGIVFGCIVATAVAACASVPFTRVTGTADFDAIWNEAAGRYPHFELKRVSWEAVRDSLRPVVEAARDGDAVQEVLTALLAALRDPHVWLEVNGHRSNPYQARRAVRDRDAFDLPQTLDRLLGEPGSANERRVRYGMLSEAVGYMHIYNFVDGMVDSGVDEALDSLRGVAALVVDVRRNQGGSQAEITRVVGRFASAGFPGLPTYVLGKPVTVPDVAPTPSSFGGPVAVIINGNCFSACESFAEMMSRLPQVTLVGDTTAGGGGGFSAEYPGTVAIGGGKARAAIPTAELRRYDGSPMEWLGIPPDVYVPQSAADVAAGRDPQLQRALDLLRGRGR